LEKNSLPRIWKGSKTPLTVPAQKKMSNCIIYKKIIQWQPPGTYPLFNPEEHLKAGVNLNPIRSSLGRGNAILCKTVQIMQRFAENMLVHPDILDHTSPLCGIFHLVWVPI
jgi:hypothetical protein